MDRKVKTHLFDILTCIEELELFFEGQEVSLETLLKDIKTIRAVERELEIIGEATKKIIKLEPGIKITNTEKIIAFRNIIAHEYGSLIYDLIVNTINYHLPFLKQEVKFLLDQQD